MSQPRSDLPQPMLVDMAAAVRAYQAQNFEQVIGLLAPWAEREPGRPEPLQMLGVALARRGRLDEALQHQARATELAPQDVAAWVNLAGTQEAAGDTEGALRSLDRAAALDDRQPAVHFNRGNVLMKRGDAEAALASFERAEALVGPHPDLVCNQAMALNALGRYQDAVTRLEALVQAQPQLAVAWNLLGMNWHQLNGLEQAMACYGRAMAFDPNLSDAFANASQVLGQLERFDEATALARRAHDMQPQNPAYLRNLGVILALDKRRDEAYPLLKQTLQWQPDEALAWNAVLSTDIVRCDWPAIESSLAQIRAMWREGKAARIEPWRLLGLPVGGQELREHTERYVRAIHPQRAERPAKPPARSPGRLRIGYFSSDFHNHATMTLMAGMFEAHDQARFETVAFCFSTPAVGDEDAVRQRVRKAFSRFEVVRELSDLDIARRARELGLHIAVDLKGHTQNNRQGIFLHRAAPVQVHHIGYPGTLGMPGAIDYLIADTVLVPETHRDFYSEKVIALPGSYQVNDRNRETDPRVPTRAELGLPEQGFVFCCFNNTYKITPDLFAVWMRLLAQRPGSVLWMLEDNAVAVANLRAAAVAQGIDPARLVFSQRAAPAQHLARHAQADLFLDTLYCNAHTTASDALWAGLPVLSCPGETFAARVAASLLMACGLPELVTDSLAAYEARALALSSGSPELAQLRERLRATRMTVPLFDTARFTRHIERAYELAWARHQQGLPPDHINVPPID